MAGKLQILINTKHIDVADSGYRKRFRPEVYVLVRDGILLDTDRYCIVTDIQVPWLSFHDLYRYFVYNVGIHEDIVRERDWKRINDNIKHKT